MSISLLDIGALIAVIVPVTGYITLVIMNAVKKRRPVKQTSEENHSLRQQREKPTDEDKVRAEPAMKSMETKMGNKRKPPYRWCVVGNIIDERYDEDGVLRHGTKVFPPNRKVYISRGFYRPTGEVKVSGLNRFKSKYELVWIPLQHITNIRQSKTSNPKMLDYMGLHEYRRLWWANTEEDRFCTVKYAEKLREWQRYFSEEAQKTILSPETIERNTELLNVLTTEPIDYTTAEKLLNSGARANGAVLCSNGKTHNLYWAVLDECLYEDDNLYKVTELLLRHGLDIENPDIPYDEEEEPHPLSDIAFLQGEYALQTLKALLDKGLGPYQASFCWMEMTIYLYINHSDSSEHKRMLIDFAQKILLIASYPNILNRDRRLRAAIWYDRNQYDTTRFRDWHNFFCKVTKEQDKDQYEYSAEKIINVYDRDTGDLVWRFGTYILPSNHIDC